MILVVGEDAGTKAEVQADRKHPPGELRPDVLDERDRWEKDEGPDKRSDVGAVAQHGRGRI
jgi:hypothetical protein